MAFYTKLNKKFLNLLKKYKIKTKQLKGINQGSENSNYFLNKNYILTIIEKKKIDILYNITILDVLFFNKFKSPKIILRKNYKKFFIYKNKFSIILSKLKGKSYKNPNKIKCFYLGKCIANLHTKTKDFLYDFNNNSLSIKYIINKYKNNKKFFINNDKKFIKKEFLNLKKYKHNLPFGLNHCDLFKDNIFFIKNKISGIFDFYFSGMDFFLFDICTVICEWCIINNKILKKNIKYFIMSYNAVRILTKFEINKIIFFIRIVCIRFFITRIINNNSNKKKKKNPYIYKKIIFFCIKNKKKIKLLIKKFVNEKKFYIKNNKL
ncbi:phosphotransferase [Candidatus Vidania fulgoroideorum]